MNKSKKKISKKIRSHKKKIVGGSKFPAACGMPREKRIEYK